MLFSFSMSDKIKRKNIKFVVIMENGGSHALIAIVLMLMFTFTVCKVCDKTHPDTKNPSKTNLICFIFFIIFQLWTYQNPNNAKTPADPQKVDGTH